jgi:hypothetical protein
MSQLTIYIPEDLDRALREGAKREGTSLSAYLAGMARRTLRPAPAPEGLADLFGAWRGDFDEPDDPAPDSVEF